MYGKKYQRKSGMKRTLVMLLTLVMLISVCFPAMRVDAEQESGLTITKGDTRLHTIPGPKGMAENAEVAVTVSPGDGGLNVTFADGTFFVNAANAAVDTYRVNATYLNAEGEASSTSFTVAVIEKAEPAVIKETEPAITGGTDTAATEGTDTAATEGTDTAATGGTDTAATGGTDTAATGGTDTAATGGTDPVFVDEEIQSYAGQELDASAYNSSSYVFWDTIKQGSGTNSGYTSATNGTNPGNVTVTLSGLGVTYHNSNGRQNGTSTNTLKSYFPEASAGKMKDATLSITPPDGYYVSKVVIACCSGGTESPHSCRTWNAGNAYDEGFTFTGTGAFSTTVSSLDFSHSSRSQRYFILIELTPVPTPLYVEYNYGNVADFLSADQISDSVFASPSGWTSTTSGNVYGIGSVQTNYTQFEYAYSAGNPSEAADWKHYANTVTTEAKQIAAQNGYYFAGWSAVMYTTCTTSENDDSFGNNYTYTFANQHSTASYSEGVNVPLKIHTKLTAVWKPITLTITKEVTGLTGSFAGSHSYGVTLYKEDVAVGQEHTLTVSGNSSASTVVSSVLPGTYNIVETSGGGNLTLGDGTTLYNTVSYVPDKVTISVEDIVAGTTNYDLKVINTYSDATPMLKFVKVWKDYDGTDLASDSSKLPSAITFTVTTENSGEQTVNLTKAGNWVATMDPLESGIVSVTESAIAGFEQQGDIQITTEHDAENKIVYTVYTATNKLSTTDITVKKTVSGNMSNRSENFPFTVEVTNGKIVAIDNVAQTSGITSHNFSLSHEDEITFKVTVGSSFKVKETNPMGYTVTIDGVAVTEGAEAEKTVSPVAWSSDPQVIVFNNDKEVTIDTGITTDSIPFILLFSLAVIGAGALLLNKRRAF